jgi:hypothetical protein
VGKASKRPEFQYANRFAELVLFLDPVKLRLSVRETPLQPWYRAPMQIPTQFPSRLLLFLLLVSATAAASNIPRHGKAVILFNGRDLTQFDTFIKTQGLNSDPNHVFQVEKGVIHVSGKEFGYIITKQEFANYYLRTEFKWGEGTYTSREGKARDSGILYHVT